MPSVNSIRVSVPLSKVGRLISNEMETYAAPTVCPAVPVADAEGQWPVFDTEFMFGFSTDSVESLRAPHAAFTSDDESLSHSSYVCQEHGFEQKIDEQEIQAAGTQYDALEMAAGRATHRTMIAWERRTVTLFCTTATYPSSSFYTTLSGGDQLDKDTSDPIGVFKTASKAIKPYGPSRSQLSIVMSPDVSTELWDHPVFLDKTKYTSAGLMDIDILRRLLGVAKVIEAGASYNGNQRNEAGSLSYCWSDYIWIGYIAPAPDRKKPSFAYTLAHMGEASSDGGPLVTRPREDNKTGRGYMVDAYHVVDEVCPANMFGYLVSDALST